MALRTVEVRVQGFTNTGKTAVAEVIRRALVDAGIMVGLCQFGEDEPPEYIAKKADGVKEYLRDTIVTIREVPLRRVAIEE
jgi:hypothetical protein